MTTSIVRFGLPCNTSKEETLRSRRPQVRREWDAYESRLDPDIIAHFWKQVDKRGPDECWPWKRATMSKGYGAYCLFSRCRTNAAAHRIAFGIANGGIPKGMHVLHRCDNPPCCNPAHLFAGTHQDNMADKTRKGRNPGQKQTHCKYGHEFTPENTYPKKSGRGSVGRGCRECLRMHCREYVRDRRTTRSKLAVTRRSV